MLLLPKVNLGQVNICRFHRILLRVFLCVSVYVCGGGGQGVGVVGGDSIDLV